MSDQNTVDLIRDLENTGKRVREMYPDPMAAPDALRHLFNTLVPRAITALRYGAAKCQNTGCDAYAFKCLCHPHFVETLNAYASRHEVPNGEIREQVEALLRLCQMEAAKATTCAERSEGALMATERCKNLSEQACCRAEAAAERAEKAAERRKR